jgi:hypothetical protein
MKKLLPLLFAVALPLVPQLARAADAPSTPTAITCVVIGATYVDNIQVRPALRVCLPTP